MLATRSSPTDNHMGSLWGGAAAAVSRLAAQRPLTNTHAHDSVAAQHLPEGVADQSPRSVQARRWRAGFYVGRASNTVAKTISAYDMSVSDAIYGRWDRYVSHKRLGAMLDHEFARWQPAPPA